MPLFCCIWEIILNSKKDCFDLQNGFLCVCKDGFELTGLGCEDRDECSDGNHQCGENAQCINNPGSYQCICQNGYFGDGSFCADDDEW